MLDSGNFTLSREPLTQMHTLEFLIAMEKKGVVFFPLFLQLQPLEQPKEGQNLLTSKLHTLKKLKI